MKPMKLLYAALLSFVLSTSAVFAETWQNSQLLNTVTETSVKSARIYGTPDGGFHSTYIGSGLRYRRYQNGNLGMVSTIATGTIYNVQIAEAGNRDLHIVWEDWSNPGIPIGWAKSTNGGTSFSRSYIPHNNTKYPYVTAYGTGNTPNVLVAAGSINYPNVSNNNMNYATYDGASWTPTQWATAVDSEYNLDGIARSPIDGSVWKLYNANDEKLYLRRYNGVTWESPILVEDQPLFRARHCLAVNAVGEIMCAWTDDYGQYVRVYTPGSGFGGRMNFQSGEDAAKVVAVPGRTEFYMVYRHNNQVLGRRYFSGAFDPPVVVSAGLPSGFYPECQVTAAGDGTLYACFEYWGSGNPQQYYTICTNFRGSDATPPVFNGPVYDDGNVQDIATFLHATWTAGSDPETGIHHYDYSIGTSPGLANVVGWIRGTDSSTEMLHTGAFAPGTYYINVRAVNNAGLISQPVSSNGIQINVAANPASFSAPVNVDSSSRAAANVMLSKASDGGLYMVYDVTDPYVHYRKRTAAGVWEAAYGIAPGKFPDITEDSTGKVHCVYTTDGRENLTMSEAIMTGGVWGAGTTIYSGMNWYPRIVSGQNGKIHLLDNSGTTHNVKFATRDTSWPALTDLGTSARYGTPDMAIGQDGIIHAVWVSGSDIIYRKYNGSWSSPVTVSTGTGYMLPRIAVDSNNNLSVVWIGQYVMKGYLMYFSRFNGSSWSAPKMIGYGHYPTVVVDKANRTHVTWTFTGNDGKDDIGHMVFNGSQWSGAWNLSNNTGASIRSAIEVTNDGNIHVAWQDDTGSTLANVLYTTASANAVPSAVSCGLSTATLLADDSTQYTATLVTTDPDGSADIVDMRVMFNIDNVTYDPASGRGYLAWGSTTADILKYGGNWSINTANGGGYWGFMTDDWGYQYITPVSCSTSVSGNQRTVTWTFKVKSAWTSAGPLTGNYIGMFMRDPYTSYGWVRSDTLFGYTFNVSGPDMGCSGARNTADGSAVNLLGKTVTAVFSDENCIYVEDPDHSAGIRVQYSGTALSIGDKVDVVGGTVNTIKPDGVTRSERVITGSVVSKTSSGTADPVVVACKAVGGGPTPYLQGVKNGVGLNIIGLLVKITGKVKKIEGNVIYIDDGSNISNVTDAGAEQTGVKVRCTVAPVVNVGDVIGVTGVIEGSVPSGWTTNQSYIRTRNAGDIRVYSY